MSFGQILKELRSASGMGIKKLAPHLGIAYSSLSKLESGTIQPSTDTVYRVAQYFHYDRDVLLLSAGKIPEEILKALRENPDEALEFLRDRFGSRDAQSKP